MHRDFSKVCVMGLGYIGLPTAALIASRGLEVLGVDIDPLAVMMSKLTVTPLDTTQLRSLARIAVMEAQVTV